MTGTKKSVTELLQAWRGGSAAAFDELAPRVYDELHQLAHRYMQKERGREPLLQTTALIHEAYLRLIDIDLDWRNRAQFIAVMAGRMRQVLIDFARARQAAKRGGGVQPLAIDDVDPSIESDVGVIELDFALRDLATFDARKSRILELRYFGGMENADIAAVLDVSLTTVERDLRVAKAWLGRALAPSG